MRKVSLVLLGALIGASTVTLGTQTRLFVGGSAVAAAADTYRNLNLFGDVFEKIRADYVEKPDEQKLIEAAINGRGVALAKQTLAQDDIDAGRLVAPLGITTAVDFAYYLVHPKAKGRLPQVKAFVSWIAAEAEAYEATLRAIDNGAGI